MVCIAGIVDCLVPGNSKYLGHILFPLGPVADNRQLWGCIFSCIPVYWSWSDTGAPAGNCIDKKTFYLAVSGVNSVTDVSLLILPIWFVVQLNYYTKGKILCCIAFLTGGFVCIVTFVRIAVLVHTDFFAVDQTWEEVMFAEWTNVEVNVAIISGKCDALHRL